MFRMKKKARGAITVFLTIIYLMVYILLGFLVDGGRIRMARAEAEEAQQLANESMMTNYNAVLYQYYNLFGETKYTAEEMGPQIKDYMQSSMSLKTSGSVKQVQNGSISGFFNNLADINNFDPYDMTVDSISTGSNLNLSQMPVFKSQINDAMKYTGPVILANNFVNILDTLEQGNDALKAAKQCMDIIDDDLLNDIDTYNNEVKYLSYAVYQFAANMDKQQSSDITNNPGTFSKPDTSAISTANQSIVINADGDLKQRIGDFRMSDYKDEVESNAEIEASNANAADESEKQSTSSKQAEKLEKVRDKVKTYKENLDDKFATRQENCKQVENRTQGMIDSGNALNVRVEQAIREMESIDDHGYETSRKTIDGFINTCNQTRDCIQTNQNACKDIISDLKTLYVGDGQGRSGYLDMKKEDVDKVFDEHIMKEKDSSGKVRVQAYDMDLKENSVTNVSSQNTRIVNALNNACVHADGLSVSESSDNTDDKISEIKNQYQEQKNKESDQVQNLKKENGSDRLGTVKVTNGVGSNDSGTGDTDMSDLNRGNARKKLSDACNATSQILDDFNNGTAEEILANLYQDAYILAYFRDYVHTGVMDTSQVGTDGYDTVANKKFLCTSTSDANFRYLSKSQYEDIETTCAEAEYVLFGDANTKADVTKMVASIFTIRMAMDTISAFICADSRGVINAAAAAAGPAAIVATIVAALSIGVSAAAVDTKNIMSGKVTTLLYTDKMMNVVNNSVSGDPPEGTVTAGYSDYLLLELIILDAVNNSKKIQRMQDIVAMNMQTLDSSFTMSKAIVDCYADTKCSVKYFFVTKDYMPTGVGRKGRYEFHVATSFSY